MIRYMFLTLLAAGTACSGAPRSLPYYRTAELTPEWLDAREASSKAMHHAGEFAFLDQRGTRFTQTALPGHVTLVSFFFTSCGSVCPMTRSNLASVLQKFPSEPHLQVALHTVTPLADSVSTLANYARDHQLTDTRWHLLTGDSSEVARVARKDYFINLHDGADYGTNQLAHTESILLIDGEGRIRGVYSGSLALEVDRIAADVRVLLTEF